jgi:hypothetical protein
VEGVTENMRGSRQYPCVFQQIGGSRIFQADVAGGAYEL